ncbi:MAG: hypothetical protein CSA70_04050 [Rhodobacterales bacterium]|nr:MAG: hypothetical protein CSA70_04050 [Rhodobacterales bacterium]
MKRILLGWWLALFAATALTAQSYPDYKTTTVNDFAGIIDDATQQEITRQLRDLRQETGVEVTVVNLLNKATYTPNETLEKFATGLFNYWSVGDAERNDGVMFLILRQDREVRIELGRAFHRDWDRAAARVLDNEVLPEFRENRYSQGIHRGVNGIINDIVRPYLDGAEPPRNGSGGLWPLLLVTVPMGLVVRCTNCDDADETTYMIAKLRKKTRSSSSFGGGSSGGGRASGRW